MNATIKKNRLSPDEIEFLRDKLKGLGLFVVIALIMCVVFFIVWPKDPMAFWVLVGFWLFFFGVLVYMISGPIRDILADEKWIVRGVVDRKVSSSHQKSSSISRSIVVSGKTYYCEYHHFSKVTAGDIVEIYYAPKSMVTFQLYVLSGNRAANSPVTKPSYKKSDSDKTSIGEIQQNDSSVINKQLLKWLRFPFFVALFCLWIILGFLLNGLWPILVFLFPVPLVFLYCAFIITKKIIMVSIDKRRGLTQIIETVVLDKTVWIRRGSEYHNLKTHLGKLSVDRKLFEKLNGGENIQVIQLPKSKLLGRYN